MSKSKGDLWTHLQKLLEQRATGQGAVQIGRAGAVTIVHVSGSCCHGTTGRKARQGRRLSACGVRGVRWAW